MESNESCGQADCHSTGTMGGNPTMSPLPANIFEERTPSAVITVPRDSPFNISLYHTAQFPLMLTEKLSPLK